MRKRFGKKSGAAENTSRSASKASRCALICGDFFSARNDLDLGTLRLLEEALIAFGGCVIVVSHDRYFLNRVCTSILAFEGEGRVVYSVGNYEYYLEKRGAPGPVRDSYPMPAGAAAEERKSKEKPRKLKWKEEREWASM